jgi:hypothetical protein
MVDAYHPRRAVEQRLEVPSGAATGVDDRLVGPEVERGERDRLLDRERIGRLLHVVVVDARLSIAKRALSRDDRFGVLEVHLGRRYTGFGASRIVLDALAVDIPASLAEALARRGAEVERRWDEALRSYLFAAAPGGPLFARMSADPDDVAVLEHEAAAREVVGTEGPLRAPPVLERGPNWLLVEAVEPVRCEGAERSVAVAAAAAAAALLELPPAPPRGGRRNSRLRTGARRLRSPLSFRDLRTARRTLADPGLPAVTSHGDFHRGNVLIKDGVAWVVDWELSGMRPAGYDLMQFWATLERPDDRERLFEAAAAIVGAPRRPALLALRHALVVRAIAGKVAGPMSFDRDEAGARELLAQLPALRAEAGL